MLKEADPTPFLIVCRSRTGSNLLVSMLDSHPHVRVRGEVIARLQDRSLDDVVDWALSPDSQDGKLQAIGFKAFYYHPLDDQDASIWALIDDRPQLRLIHLVCQNILRTLTSRKIAGFTDKWSANDLSENPQRRVSFGVEELKSGFLETSRWQAEFRERYVDRGSLELKYESLVQNTETEYSRLTNYLGVKYEAPRTALTRQNPEPLPTLIVNFDELEREFAGTRWHAYFREDTPGT